VAKLEAYWAQAGCQANKPLLLDLKTLHKLTAVGMRLLWVLTKPWVEQRSALYLRDNEAIAPLIAWSGLSWLFTPCRENR
jgi:hypothetical protein